MTLGDATVISWCLLAGVLFRRGLLIWDRHYQGPPVVSVFDAPEGEHGTSGGIPLTDDLIERLAEEAEAGYTEEEEGGDLALPSG